MTLLDIMGRCSALRIADEICKNELYVEVVFYKEELDKWNALFTEIFGSAMKPAGIEPTEEHLTLTKDYGGVRGGILSEQILFKKIFDGRTVIAMFWPWQECEEGTEEKITLKMAVLRKAKE